MYFIKLLYIIFIYVYNFSKNIGITCSINFRICKKIVYEIYNIIVLLFITVVAYLLFENILCVFCTRPVILVNMITLSVFLLFVAPPHLSLPQAAHIHPHPHTGVPGALADDSARLPGSRLNLPLHSCSGLH